MYTILFFQNSFFTNLLSLSRSKQIYPVFLYPETKNYRTKLLSSFFLNKNISILYTFSLSTTYTLLALHTKMFCLSFLHITILTLENFNKTKKQVLEMLHQHFLIGKLKNIFHNLRKHFFS